MTTPVAARTNPRHNQTKNNTPILVPKRPLDLATPENHAPQKRLKAQQSSVGMRQPSSNNLPPDYLAAIKQLQDATNLPSDINKKPVKKNDWTNNIPFFISLLKEKNIPLKIGRSTIHKKLEMICQKNQSGLASLQKLWDACKNKGLTPIQIIKIAANGGGSQALQSVLANFKALEKAGFSTEQIVNIAANIGGSQALQSVLANFKALEKAGFSTEQIVKIAANGGGSQALKSVLANFKALEKAGFSTEQIIKIAANGGGSKTLQSVLANFKALEKAGYSTEQIVKIAANDGGSQALQSVLANFKALEKAGFSTEQIVKIAANKGGSKTLQSVLANFKALQGAGFSTEGIVKIVAKDGGGAQAINMILFLDEGLNNPDPIVDEMMAQEDTATTNELFDSLDLADALEADSSFLDEEDVRPSKRPRFD